MPFSPTPRDLHIDTFLTQLSVAFRNPKYIADLIFPIVPVNKQSDIVLKYDQSHWFRDDATLRAPGTKSQGGGYTVDQSDHYFSARYSYRKEIDDDTRDNADSVFNLDRDATEFATDKLQMRREINFATTFMTTGVWGGGDPAGGVAFTQWSNYGSSTPLVDILKYQDAIEALTGVEPRTFVCGKQVRNQLKWHPTLLDTIKYTQKALLTDDLIASLIDFDKFLVGRSIYTTTPQGVAEASVSYTRIWGKNALMVYVPERPSLLTVSAGYTFVWNRVANAIQYIKRMRDEEREVDIFESNSYFDQHKTVKNAGTFLATVVA